MDLVEGQLRPGLVLGRYELLAPVAKGGMAEVWAARLTGSRGFQKTVAIKTMLPNLTEDHMFEQMFLDEAALASRIRHPNAVEIMDLGENAGILYLVMEWIDGESLSVVMKNAVPHGGMPIPIAVRIAMQACAGLHAAHELRDEAGQLVGLVHRDVSPQNILVTYDGVVKVVDFGVAKATGRVSAETAAGQIKGKVPYMSPEQAVGGDVDRRTDLFAMGILLYMMTTGRHPFKKENDAQTLFAICSASPPSAPSALVEDYPPELEEIVTKALSKVADERYQTGNAMQKALAALPGELRASTDEEVAEFMQSILAERITKRRALIQKAQKDADRRAEGRHSQAEVSEEVSSQLTPMSGVSQLSEFGPPPSRGSSTSAGMAVVSDPDIDSAMKTVPPVAHPKGRGGMGAAALVLMLAAGGAAAYFAMGRGMFGSRQAGYVETPAAALEAPHPVAPPTTAATTAPAAPSAAEPASPDPSDHVVDMQLEDDPAAPAGSSAKARGALRAHRGPIAAAPKGKPAPAAPAPEAPAAPPKPAPPAKPSGPGAFVSPFRDPDF